MENILVAFNSPRMNLVLVQCVHSLHILNYAATNVHL